MIDDKQLLIEILPGLQNNDDGAWRTLRETFEKRLNRFAMNHFYVQRNDAEDIVQIAYRSLVSKVKNLEVLKLGYLYGAVYLAGKNYSRTKRTHNSCEVGGPQSDDGQSKACDPDDKQLSPLKVLEDDESFSKAMECLTEKEREVIKWVYLEESPYNVIAQLLHVDEKTVYNRLRSAKEKLKRYYSDLNAT
tara:strand:+ start:14149 stop:14721 length:573 start_codon:yes stop_codon:yes gene_type:complete